MSGVSVNTNLSCCSKEEAFPLSPPSLTSLPPPSLLILSLLVCLPLQGHIAGGKETSFPMGHYRQPDVPLLFPCSALSRVLEGTAPPLHSHKVWFSSSSSQNILNARPSFTPLPACVFVRLKMKGLHFYNTAWIYEFIKGTTWCFGCWCGCLHRNKTGCD